MKTSRVRVRRDRPTAPALAVALCLTMLVVYLLTLNAGGPDVVESMATAPRVTRELRFEALTGWCVTLARCDSAEEARLQASAWVGRGAAGYVTQLDGGWAVVGAVYDAERDARRIADRLSDGEGLSAEVVRLEAGPLTLRVTAPEAQIEAIAEADALLRRQGRQLGDVALQLDRGEIGPDAVRTLCALAVTECDDAAAALAAIPGSSDSPLCSGLIECLGGLSRMQSAVADSRASGASLSGMLRCARAEGFIGQWALVRRVRSSG